MRCAGIEPGRLLAETRKRLHHEFDEDSFMYELPLYAETRAETTEFLSAVLLAFPSATPYRTVKLLGVAIDPRGAAAALNVARIDGALIIVSLPEQAPSGGESRTQRSVDQNVVAKIVDRGLTRGGVVEQEIRVSVAIKIRRSH
jgi:flavin-binding protein dodecin